MLARLQEHIRLDQLEAIILTHLHADHISDMGVLGYALDLSRKYGLTLPKVPLYLPATPAPLAENLKNEDLFESHILTDDQPFTLFGATIRCFAMAHPFETYGLRIEQAGRIFATTADTLACASLAPLLRQADLALMDSGSLARLRTPARVHLTAGECGSLAAENQVRRLLLCHLLPLFDPEEALAEAGAFRPDAELARPGRTYEI